jgi:hypothetical protein
MKLKWLGSEGYQLPSSNYQVESVEVYLHVPIKYVMKPGWVFVN